MIQVSFRSILIAFIVITGFEMFVFTFARHRATLLVSSPRVDGGTSSNGSALSATSLSSLDDAAPLLRPLHVPRVLHVVALTNGIDAEYGTIMRRIECAKTLLTKRLSDDESIVNAFTNATSALVDSPSAIVRAWERLVALFASLSLSGTLTSSATRWRFQLWDYDRLDWLAHRDVVGARRELWADFVVALNLMQNFGGLYVDTEFG